MTQVDALAVIIAGMVALSGPPVIQVMFLCMGTLTGWVVWQARKDDQALGRSR